MTKGALDRVEEWAGKTAAVNSIQPSTTAGRVSPPASCSKENTILDAMQKKLTRRPTHFGGCNEMQGQTSSRSSRIALAGKKEKYHGTCITPTPTDKANISSTAAMTGHNIDESMECWEPLFDDDEL